MLAQLKEAWDLYTKVVAGVDPVLDALVGIGLIRDSRRRKQRVINQKFWPKGALDAWHTNRYSNLIGKLAANRRHILDMWMCGLAEPQQYHFKIEVANLSWGPNATEEKANTKIALDFLNEMALEPSDDARTARAEGRDFIKDPPEKYPIVWLETLAGKKFTDPDELRKWVAKNVDAVKSTIGSGYKQINDAIGRPSMGGAPATGIVAHSESFRAKMEAFRDRSRQ